jgi:tetratricopeptide (TPR) repeat protein
VTRARPVHLAIPLVVGVVGVVGAFAIGDASAAGVVVSTASGEVVRKAPECAPLFKGAAGSSTPVTNLWESAKTPALAAHCHRLQQGIDAFRDQKYAAAVDLAQKAELDTPGLAGPWVVRGEAFARWGRMDDAVKAFEKAKDLNARSLDDAETLDDYGAALLRLGKLDDAKRIYRALLPRVSGAQGLCGMKNECDAAGLAYLTAGALALAGGTKALDEAVAILREARSKSELGHDVRRVASLALALALDRRGDVDQAKELATDVAQTKGIPTEISGEILARLPMPEEGHAMRAIGLEASDAAAAVDAWKAFLANGGDKGPWADNAKAHLAKLSKPEKAPKKKVP